MPNKIEGIIELNIRANSIHPFSIILLKGPDIIPTIPTIPIPTIPIPTITRRTRHFL